MNPMDIHGSLIYSDSFNAEEVKGLTFSLQNNGTIDSTSVTLSVFDIRGRLVQTLVWEGTIAGPHVVQWNGYDDRVVVWRRRVFTSFVSRSEIL